MLQSKLKKRLDTFDEFWNSFYARNASFKKQVGLYKVDTIDNPNMITTTVNQYFEKFCNKQFNKKHKGLKKMLKE